MPKYMNVDAIMKRLEGKVRFAAPGDTDPNKLGGQLLNSLLNEAESQLEIDLMMRYELPFQGQGGTFSELPDTTRLFLTTIAELLGTIRILETDFGRGTSANAEKYVSALQKRYEKMVKDLMEIKEKSYQTWLRPPLAGLKLAYSNQGDTGFRGRVHNTTTIRHEADYAYKQINSPGEDWFNGIIDSVDHGGHG